MSASTFQIDRTALVPHTGRPGIVAKGLVHRDSAEEVLLTGWRRYDGSRFTVTALWPSHHSFFAPDGNTQYDPLLVAETVRQLCTLLAHTEFGVPLGHKFPLRGLWVSVHPEHLRVGDGPALIDIDVTCSDIRQRSGTLTGIRFHAVFRRNGRILATAAIGCLILEPVIYQRIRGANAGRTSRNCRPPLSADYPPLTVGRAADMDVALESDPEQDRWLLRMDTRHPVFFDHPLDHAPGMLLLEAARQAAVKELQSSWLALVGIDGDFERYVELDSPCTIETRRLTERESGAEAVVLVTGRQNDRVCFTIKVTASHAG